MTVEELRERLEDAPDEAPVLLYDEEASYLYTPTVMDQGDVYESTTEGLFGMMVRFASDPPRTPAGQRELYRVCKRAVILR